MIITLVVIITFVILYILFMQRPVFGRMPAGERLQLIKQQSNYKNGGFENQNFTPALTEGVTYYEIITTFLFSKPKRSKPDSVLPSQKTDLHTLSPDKNVLVWFGHSSYFMQVDGRKFLVDPVFSGSASPLGFTTRSFPGSDVYSVDDMPEIDYLIITHDHYDHMDYETLKLLKPKVKKVITSLGVGEHLDRWDYDKKLIIEKSWNEQEQLEPSFTINTTPARHFSGRTFKRNQSLWQSFVLTTPTLRLFLGGDSGYDTHFAEIGNKYGPFDLVILECGQYNKNWRYIHMLPPEVVQAAHDLKAKWLLPVHWGKFTLSLHDWDEPITAVTTIAKEKDMPIVTPMIGQELNLKNISALSPWWENVQLTEG